MQFLDNVVPFVVFLDLFRHVPVLGVPPKPSLEKLKVVESVGHQKVQQAPKLRQVVLQRRPGQQYTLVRVQAL